MKPVKVTMLSITQKVEQKYFTTLRRLSKDISIALQTILEDRHLGLIVIVSVNR